MNQWYLNFTATGSSRITFSATLTVTEVATDIWALQAHCLLNITTENFPNRFYFSLYRYDSTSRTVIIVIRRQSLWSSRSGRRGEFHGERRKEKEATISTITSVSVTRIQRDRERADLPFQCRNCEKFPWDSNVIAAISLCQCSSLHELKLKYPQPQEFTFITQE